MNNNYVTPIDPLIQENNNDLFYADEKMHYILEHGNIQSYLDYVKNKHKINKPHEIKPEIKLQEYTYDRNRYKKQMLDSIWTNIVNLENTIKKFKNIK
jgi:hypothetical protein